MSQSSSQTTNQLVDTRINQIRPLIPPACLIEELPVPPQLTSFIANARSEIAKIIHHEDDRLLVVIGPCSIHDPESAIEYAQRLKIEADKHRSNLLIAARVYFEKPRTRTGWKGLTNDPNLDGTFAINHGLRLSRNLMLQFNTIGLPVACEMLDVISPQYLGDLVSWGAIGARTTESQLHRELVSGLSFGVGFKNGTGGSKQIAVDAIIASQSPHCFLSVTSQGIAAIVETKGNLDTHIVLRGSEKGPNFEREHIDESASLLVKAGAEPSIMIDCSHGNSRKLHSNQSKVVSYVCEELKRDGASSVIGLMIESNLVEGNQKLECGPGAKEKLRYGQSVTDACIGWDETERVLQQLSDAVVERRKHSRK